MRKPADLTKPAYFLTLVAMTTNNTHNVSGYLSIAYFGLLTDYLGEHGLDAAGLPGGPAQGIDLAGPGGEVALLQRRGELLGGAHIDQQTVG